MNNQEEINKKPLVTCQFYGQLGNQLFIIAATLGYAWDYDAIAIFPGLQIAKNRTNYNKDRLFFRLNTEQSPRPFSHIYRTDLESEWFSSKRIPFKPDLIIDGYFQSWKHFHHHREKILDVFAPSDFTEHYLSEKYKVLLEDPKAVGIHVRTQSKLLHDNGHHPFWGMNYYKEAMNQFPEDSKFVVVSDRINWCKHQFSKLNKNVVFIEGNYGIEDLFLLTKFKGNIFSNSSFSWWAAYLNTTENPLSVFPKYWKEPNRYANPPEEDFFLPEWKLIDYSKKEPYPSDIWDYDQVSQSIDNNN